MSERIPGAAEGLLLRRRELIRAVGAGPDLVFSLIERFRIDCDARRCGIITAAHSATTFDDLRRRVEIWVARGAPLEVLDAKIDRWIANGGK